MAQPSAVRLLDLPTEIQLQIISYLGYPSCLALSQTNSFFKSMITVEKPTTSEQKLLFLCAAENWTKSVLSFVRPGYHHGLYTH